MLNIGVLVSGGGTNLQALLDRIDEGYIKNARISTVVSSKQGVYALQRASDMEIPSAVISGKEYESIDLYDKALIEHFSRYDVELIVMAGFLSFVGTLFVTRYKDKIINIHPSLIPSFCGKGYYGLVPHIKAIEYGVRLTGATVHFVNEEYDKGPVILQKAVPIKRGDTPEILQKRVMEQAEWILLPLAVKLFAENRLVIKGRHVIIEGDEELQI